MFSARFAPFALLAIALATSGCHAQQPQPAAPANASAASSAAQAGTPLPPELARKIEVMLRQKANLPPESSVNIGGRTASDWPGYDQVMVTVVNSGRTSRPILFLLSKDGKTLAQITKFDISADPKNLVSGSGRPARGGPENAPVLIVGFDDLECPYCARLHESIFPALTQRYGDKVRFVYKDFPLDQHPWAQRAAVDVNCIGAQSDPGYWAEVDYIHAHAGEIGTDAKDPKAEKTLARANEQLDTITRQQGEFRKIDMPRLNACLAKQDATAVNASKELGTQMGLESTPTLFINGDKIDGAVSLEFLFGIIDNALRVAGVQPPPPYVAPKAPTTPAAQGAGTPTPATAPKGYSRQSTSLQTLRQHRVLRDRSVCSSPSTRAAHVSLRQNPGNSAI